MQYPCAQSRHQPLSFRILVSVLDPDAVIPLILVFRFYIWLKHGNWVCRQLNLTKEVWLLDLQSWTAHSSPPSRYFDPDIVSTTGA